ncbi:MAG: hypothetical protein QME78_10125 [Thermodesulfobacteriota bacterium]|nr:hypothetical protein [Thermodesulfobacteriota bacterium]
MSLDKITITIKIEVDLKDVPPEKLKTTDPLGDMRKWAQEFKEDMEGDSEFGTFTKVSVVIE